MPDKPTYEELEKRVKELEEQNRKIVKDLQSLTSERQLEPDLTIYQNIISSTTDGIAFLDKNYRYIIVNDSYEKFSGVKRENFIGKTVAEYLGRDVFEQAVKPNFDRCLKGEIINFQEWFDYPTLGKKFIDISYYPYKDAQNDIVGVVANTRDITEQKKTELELKESRDKYRTLFESANDAIFVASAEDGTLLDANKMAERLTGRSKDEIIGMHQSQLHPHEQEDYAITSFCDDAQRKEKVFYKDFIVLHKSGRKIPVEICPSFIEIQGKPCMLGIFRDVSQKRKTENELIESERKYRLLAENIHDVIWTLDEKLANYTYMSPSIKKLLGYTPEEMMEKPFGTFMNNRYYERIQKAVKERLARERQGKGDDRVKRWEGEYVGKNGEIIYVESITQPIRDENGVFQGLLGVTRDITARRKAEEALRESEMRFRTHFCQFPLPIFVWKYQNGEFILCDYNKAADKITDGKVKTILGISAKVLYSDESSRHLHETLTDCYRRRRTIKKEFPYRLVTTGSEKWISGTWVYIEPETVILHTEDITEKKMAENALQESEKRFRAIFDSMPLLLALWKRENHRFILSRVNPAILSFSHSKINKYLGSTLDEFYKDCPWIIEAIEQCYANRSTVHCENIYTMRSTGEEKYLSFIFTYVPEDMVMAVSTDITERKQAEEALRSSNEKLTALIEASPLAVIALDSESNVTLWNPAAENMFGWKEKEVVDRFLPLVPKEKISEHHALRKKVLKGEKFQDVEVYRKRKDGSDICISISTAPMKDPKGRVTGILSISADITKRKQMEEALRESEERYRMLINRIQAAIVVHDADTKIVALNPKAQELLGLTEDQMLGKTAFDPGWHFIDANEKKLSPEEYPVNRVISSQKPLKDQILGIIRPFKPNRIWIQLYAVPVFNDKNQLHQIIVTCFDITERKQSEEKLLQLQKAESLGMMAGAIAHHFNNMMAAVVGNLEMAREEIPRETLVSQNISEAEKAAHRASAMSHLMLAYLGQKKGELKPFDLSDAVRRSMEQLRLDMPEKIKLNVELSSHGPVVSGNPAQFEQVVKALVINAWEAVEDRIPGRVDVSAKTVPATTINEEKCFPINWECSEKYYASLTVRDNGKGMHPEFIGKIFDPFFSDKFTGRGLGLAVALGNIKSQGGCITVESKPGEGSTIQVFLPLSREEIYLPEENKEFGAHTFSWCGKVLLIEDEDMVRKISASMLKKLGFTVLYAGNGMEAVKIFSEDPEKITLVLSDLSMPKMNGWETLAALRRIRPNIPVILASGYNEAQIMAEIHKEKPQAFLHKPYQLNTLKETIRKVLVSAQKNS